MKVPLDAAVQVTARLPGRACLAILSIVKGLITQVSILATQFRVLLALLMARGVPSL